MNNFNQDALEVKELLALMTEEEKREAFMLLKGMLVGKELAQQEKESA